MAMSAVTSGCHCLPRGTSVIPSRQAVAEPADLGCALEASSWAVAAVKRNRSGAPGGGSPPKILAVANSCLFLITITVTVRQGNDGRQLW